VSARGKRYSEARAAIDREKLYAPGEAFATLKAAPDAKFDETVEVHFRLGLNVRHADEQLRGTIMLPHGTGSSTSTSRSRRPTRWATSASSDACSARAG
jgi:large subunit ribosomal protein L1